MLETKVASKISKFRSLAYVQQVQGRRDVVLVVLLFWGS